MRLTGLHSFVYSQCSDDMALLGEGLPRSKSAATCQWQRQGFKLEDIDCSLTWREMSLTKSSMPWHTMLEFLSDTWRKLISCSTSTLGHIGLMRVWLLGGWSRYITTSPLVSVIGVQSPDRIHKFEGWGPSHDWKLYYLHITFQLLLDTLHWCQEFKFWFSKQANPQVEGLVQHNLLAIVSSHLDFCRTKLTS